VGQKKDIKLQARLAKIERHDNGHPVQSVWYLKWIILPALVKLQEIQKFQMKRKLNQEEINEKLRSMTPEMQLRKGPALSNAKAFVWLWRIKQRKPNIPQDSKVSGNTEDLSKSWRAGGVVGGR